MKIKNILLLSLMIILGKYEFIFYRRSHKFLVHLKHSKQELKRSRERPLKLSKQILVENTAQMSFIFFYEEHDIIIELTTAYTP